MVLAETTGASTIYYWHGLGLVAQTDGTAVEYFAEDGLGSVRQVVGSTSTLLMTQTFDPYGNLYVRNGVNESTFGFSGEQTDANGLIFLRARYYNPAQGRFMQADPSRFERNPYLFALANPILHTDPLGLAASYPKFDSEVALEIVEEYSKISSVEALVQLFINPKLDSYIISTGQTAAERLEFILRVTEGEGVWIQFAIDFGENGLRCEYQDGWLFDLNGWAWHRAPGTRSPDDPGLKTNQIGHFLTAARLEPVMNFQRQKAICWIKR